MCIDVSILTLNDTANFVAIGMMLPSIATYKEVWCGHGLTYVVPIATLYSEGSVLSDVVFSFPNDLIFRGSTCSFQGW